MKAKIFFLVLFVAMASPLLAKARNLTPAEMIERAEVIAVVTVVSVEPAEQQGDHWVYRQKAVLHSERILKGRMDSSETAFAQKNFICASASFSKGRYLVFLVRDKKGFLVSANHGNGLVPIENDVVQWSSEGRYGEKSAVPLAKIEKGILSKVKG